MRANIRGGGGDIGKCTVEVNVDGAADVEIRGTTAYIRTLQGQPAGGVRFDCTSPLPPNPVDFRFQGVDGRGRVQLIRDPGTSGVAVVRIEDPQGGRENYTFDLTWRGNGAYSNNGYGQYGPYNNGTYNRNDPYYPGSSDPNYRNNDPYRRDTEPSYRNNRSRSAYGYGNGNTGDYAQSAGMCESAVRDQARRQYGVRSPRFYQPGVNDARGNRDRVVGSFDDNRGGQYDYSCTVNPNNGNIRNVDIRRR